MSEALDRSTMMRLFGRNLLAWGAFTSVVLAIPWILLGVSTWVELGYWDRLALLMLGYTLVAHLVIVMIPCAFVSAWRFRKLPLRKIHPAPYFLTLVYVVSLLPLIMGASALSMIVSIPLAGFLHWRMARQARLIATGSSSFGSR